MSVRDMVCCLKILVIESSTQIQVFITVFIKPMDIWSDYFRIFVERYSCSSHIGLHRCVYTSHSRWQWNFLQTLNDPHVSKCRKLAKMLSNTFQNHVLNSVDCKLIH